MQGRRATLTPKVAWLCVLSLCYYAAVTIGDTVAQSVFVSRMGVAALPNIFLLKAGIDVLSGLFYLPLTKGRSPRRVWRVLLTFYALVVAAGWWASASDGSDVGAYILYAGHEVAWTLAVIHWGIFLLDVFTPSDSRKLFPVLFGVGRLGALLGGLIVGSLALPVGASNLLGIAIAMAVVSIFASSRLGSQSALPEPRAGEDSGRREAFASPLIRFIALSTATMVILRYGLRMISLHEIRTAFDQNKDQVAAFLGFFSVVGNALAFVLGLYVVPRLLARLGVGVANLAYASSTVFAFLLTWLFPGLATASAARFVEMPLKHSLKTPLSVLFYGAENARVRIAARSLIFGVAIPIATVTTGLCFRELRGHLGLISILGVGISLLYLGICAGQNRSYRLRLAHLLSQELQNATVDGPCAEAWSRKLAGIAPNLNSEALRLSSQAFAANDKALRSLSLVMLSEQLPHHLARAMERATLQPDDG
ncbi:MAG: hypothetical protein GY811_30555 [Myxococcales bacterium]|nr:hypothetical protein [Myxococcales bacterium]